MTSKRIRIVIFEDYYLHPLVCGYVQLPTTAARWKYVKTTAPYWRIYWNNKPGAFIFQDKRRIALKSNIIVLVPPNAIFSTCCNTRRAIRHFYLHFLSYPLLVVAQAKIVALPITTSLRCMIREIIELMHTSAPHGLKISLAARGLIEWAISGTSEKLCVAPAFDPRIVKVIRYISEQLSNPLSNNELARQADMSTNAFRILFRSQTGQTPHAYVRAKRIEKACHLLHAADLSIKQIAELTGFYDCHHFTRVFKRLQGMGPAEFRHQDHNPFIENPPRKSGQ